ncbi:MAG: hypothetical protein LBK28_08645 [Propionibacteriaceae bacterium]|jgi:hypothetical protein|nr:hypothetical protein [Propionibacteriaceae bacterium]
MVSWSDVKKWDPVPWDDLCADLRNAHDSVVEQQQCLRDALEELGTEYSTAAVRADDLEAACTELDSQASDLDYLACATKDLADAVWEVRTAVRNAHTVVVGYRELSITSAGDVICAPANSGDDGYARQLRDAQAEANGHISAALRIAADADQIYFTKLLTVHDDFNAVASGLFPQ